MSSDSEVDSCENLDTKWSLQSCRGLMPDWSLRLLEESEDSDFKSQWRRSRTLLAHEMPLSVLSCIQLASKAAGACASTNKLHPSSSHTARPPLSTAHVRDDLLKAGLTYKLKEVIESEFQVFKTLGFRIPLWTQIDITDLLSELVHLPKRAHRPARAFTKLAQLRKCTVRRRTRVHGTLVMPAAGVLAASKLMGVCVQTVRDDLARITEVHPRMLECVADVIVTIALE